MNKKINGIQNVKFDLQLFGDPAPEDKITKVFAKAQSIDFVNRFGEGLKTLLDLLGVERMISMPIGSTIQTYKSSVTLDGGDVAPGAIIPLSEVKQEPAEKYELAWKKHRKAVTAEDVQKYGFEQSIVNTDNLLIKELQKGIRQNIINQLATATGVAQGVGLQGACAQAWGGVQVVFEDDGVDTIGFLNPLDIADYLEKANVTIQNAFGLSYIENFLGFKVAVITSLVPKNTVYATAPENLVFAYGTMNGGELARAFDFYTDETGIVGVTHDIVKQRLQAETITASATVLFAERIDGVIKSTIADAVGA